MRLRALSISIQEERLQGGSMLRIYTLAIGALLVALGGFYIQTIRLENKSLKQSMRSMAEENAQLMQAQKSLYDTIKELEKRREQELKIIQELQKNNTRIHRELDTLKADIKKNPSGDIVKDFNRALDGIFKDNPFNL